MCQLRLRLAPLTILLAATAGVLAGCKTPTKAAPSQPAFVPKTYTCRWAAGPIQLDGKLDESAWASAEILSAFYSWPEPKEPVPVQTVARLIWDENNLYFGFEAQDADVWSFSRKADDTLWRADVGELFVRPRETDLSYYEFVISPNGSIYDSRYASRGSGGPDRHQQWQSGARIATHVDGSADDWKDTDRGYTLEVAIPLTTFAELGHTPKPGDHWRFAVCRMDYSKTLEAELRITTFAGKGVRGFHSYEMFDWMLFEGRK